MKRFILQILSVLTIYSVSAQKSTKETPVSSGENFQVSLVLPFCADEILDNPRHKNAATAEVCRQYYEGFLLALDSFKTSPIPIEIKVYDTHLDSLGFRKILDKKELANSDLIIGPVMKEGNQILKDYSAKKHIYHVSPFLTLTKSSINDPFLISAYPDLKYYAEFILNQIKEGGDNEANIIILTGKESNDKLLASQFSTLKTQFPGFTFKTIELSKYTDFKNAYKFNKANHVVIASENEFLVNSALKFLGDTTQFLDLNVIGFRKWLEFKSPNIPLWERLHVKIISPFFCNYQNAEVKLFIEKYRERYYTEPTEYAINGYEHAVFFIAALINQHGDLSSINKIPVCVPLTNPFKIAPKRDSSSLQNTMLNVIYFEEGEMKRKESKVN